MNTLVMNSKFSKGSQEERVESWNDVRDRFNDLLKRPVDRFAWHREILPRYADGRLSFHLAVAVNGKNICYEIAANRECSGATHAVAVHRQPVDERDSHAIEFANGEQRHSVFVLVYEIMEPPQRIIPSTVRLRHLDLVHGRCGNATLRKTIKFLIKPIINTVDRKR